MSAMIRRANNTHTHTHKTHIHICTYVYVASIKMCCSASSCLPSFAPCDLRFALESLKAKSNNKKKMKKKRTCRNGSCLCAYITRVTYISRVVFINAHVCTFRMQHNTL